MNVENLKETIKSQDGLSNTLGMEFISTPEPDTLQATMKVDNRNKQIFGFLSGGASLALAENLAGVGSMALCPGKISVGINVNGQLWCYRHGVWAAVAQGKNTPYLAYRYKR